MPKLSFKLEADFTNVQINYVRNADTLDPIDVRQMSANDVIKMLKTDTYYLEVSDFSDNEFDELVSEIKFKKKQSA
jgi:hypothetical protein